ncbi:TNF receptor-associated factor 5 isoform X2 [Exaiptasia diaphana]|uniref:RING-type domain-containing protein n=1 Tax=Exaiptasia diaphana TaxID=2652724 RepID=A0A913YU59_EXADI|nr:TNF receptor-associated factor 5 isoform X2 [Exaiptasia diaphana]
MCRNMDEVIHFDEQKIVFVKQLDPSYLCIVCNNLLHKPKQTSCGHRICENCLPTLTKRSPNARPRCPIDEIELDLKDTFPDKCCERDILSLQCFCPNSKKGCDWEGDFGSLKTGHQARTARITGCMPQSGTDYFI